MEKQIKGGTIVGFWEEPKKAEPKAEKKDTEKKESKKDK